MREIKFRAWDEKYGYEYWNSLTCPSYSVPEVFCQGRLLEQFTGLRDKNNKEIYEGDIVKSLEWVPGSGIMEETIVTVEYQDGGFYPFAFEWERNLHPDKCEVIGNIHEKSAI